MKMVTQSTKTLLMLNVGIYLKNPYLRETQLFFQLMKVMIICYKFIFEPRLVGSFTIFTLKDCSSSENRKNKLLYAFDQYFVFKNEPEINATAKAESFYRFVDIEESALLLDRNQTIMNQDAYSIVTNNLNTLDIFDSSMHQEHSLNIKITNQIYLNAFQEFYVSTLYNINNRLSDFVDGAIYQGMAVGIARYFENLRYIMDIYDQFWNNAKFYSTDLWICDFQKYIQELRQYNKLCFKSQQFQSYQMQDNYHRGTFVIQLKKCLREYIKGWKLVELRFLHFSLYLKLFCSRFISYCGYLLVVKITKNIWRTRSMIMMIPLRVIQKKYQIYQIIYQRKYTGQ